MKGFLSFIFGFAIGSIIVLGIIQCGFLLLGPDYKEGEYTMVYKVYYSSNYQKTYTVKNDLPICIDSNRGSNSVVKTVKLPFFKKAFGNEIVFETSAPIEVVSYTHREN